MTTSSNRVATDGLVSVIVPLYNCARYVGEALDSVQRQTHKSIETIVVDDGSDDGGGDIARGFPSVRYVRQERAGTGPARNRGVGMARGTFLAFLDADDRWVPRRLEDQMSVLAADPTVDCVFGHVREFVSPEIDEEARGRIRPPTDRAPGFMTPSMLIRREAFDQVGPFAARFRVGVDLDWYARLTEKGLEIRLIPEIVWERRLHAHNSWQRERESRGDVARVLKAALDRRRSER
jgi:glycosyltransferase involved in cell wall biosynthesis